jgi:chaperone required for assembly of F1-ATPase
MKRFYKSAGAIETDSGYGVGLDGKPVRTPGKRLLVVPGAALAEAIAAEWEGQGETIDRETMSLTRLVCAALDLLPAQRSSVIDDVAKYAETDLVCYRAERPPALVHRQVAAWQPLVEWADARYGAPLAVTTGVLPIAQDPVPLAALRAAVAACDDLTLGCLSFATKTLGSLVIALAMLERRIDATAAAEASLVDERHQIERWGADDELMDRCEHVVQDVASADRLFRLLAD